MIHFIVQVLTLIHIRLVLSLPMSKVLESEDESDPQNPLLVAVSSEARQPVRRFHCTNEAVGPPSVQHSSAHRIGRHRQLPRPGPPRCGLGRVRFRPDRRVGDDADTDANDGDASGCVKLHTAQIRGD